MTVVRGLYVIVADWLLFLVVTGVVWVPCVLGLLVVLALWSRRGGHLRTPGRTPVLDGVRRSPHARPDTGAPALLTCADTSPDVSAAPCPGVSGQDEEGES